MSLQRFGGWSAMVLAFAYVAGMILNFTVLDTTEIVDPVARTRFAVEHHRELSAFILSLYVVFGCLLVPVGLALHERQKSTARGLSLLATAFALIWAALLIGSGLVHETGLSAVRELYAQNPSDAARLMTIVDVVHQGLGCTREIPGGLWILLASLATLRSRALSRTWSLVGVVIGVAGLASIVPALFVPSVAVYALLSIAWYVGLGLTLMKTPQP